MKIRNKYILFTLLFAFFCKNGFAQKQDLSITLHESVLNKMFKAIGEIKGTSPYSFMFIEGTYDWTLINPQIKLHTNKAEFVTDVKVAVGKYIYTIHVSGNVEVCYEPTTNLVYVEVREARFPLNIMFLGKIRHLWDVNLEQYFDTPLTFEGPLTVGTEIQFEMPDKSIKTLYAHPLNCGVKVAERQILVSAEVEFVTREPAALIPVKK
ncbi:MAG: hypothetical protein M3R27_02265 [Bacteroidota bacterium]|nr:hypothetical protein [Bacteroidota bacterium]